MNQSRINALHPLLGHLHSNATNVKFYRDYPSDSYHIYDYDKEFHPITEYPSALYGDDPLDLFVLEYNKNPNIYPWKISPVKIDRERQRFIIVERKVVYELRHVEFPQGTWKLRMVPSQHRYDPYPIRIYLHKKDPSKLGISTDEFDRKFTINQAFEYIDEEIPSYDYLSLPDEEQRRHVEALYEKKRKSREDAERIFKENDKKK